MQKLIRIIRPLVIVCILIFSIFMGFTSTLAAPSYQPSTWNLSSDKNTALIIENAEDNTGLSGSQSEQSKSIIDFFNRIVQFLTGTVGTLALFALIAGGFMMVIGSANNNEEGIFRAKEIIKYALVGLALVFFSYLIVRFLQVLLYT